MKKKAVVISESNKQKPRISKEIIRSTFPANYRSLGAHVIKHEFEKLGVESTVIDFCFHFDEEDLIKGVINFLRSSDVQFICISATLSMGLEQEYIALARKIKSKLPNAKILYGGNRRVQRNDMEYMKHCDGIFLGRCAEMLSDFVAGKDMSKFVQNPEFTNIFSNHNYNYDIEKPITYGLFKDDDFLESTDVIGFEVALGCKFNCSFCNYPLRASKTLYMNCEEQLYYTMQHAYDTYGITHFYAADDTINESDEKLELLAKVVNRLSFKPRITSFARLDVMAKRPHQIDLYKEIGMNGANFGIESFGNAAIKATRKKSTIEDLVYVSQRLRKEIDDFWISSGFIFGLANDSYEEFEKNLRYCEDNLLVDNAGTITLIIEPKKNYPGYKDFGGEWLAWDEGAFADIDIYPERFGYTIDENTLEWSNEYTNKSEAKERTDIASKAIQKRNVITNHIEAFTWQSVMSQGIASSRNDWYEQKDTLSGLGLVQKATYITDQTVNRYVNKKLNWLLNEV